MFTPTPSLPPPPPPTQPHKTNHHSNFHPGTTGNDEDLSVKLGFIWAFMPGDVCYVNEYIYAMNFSFPRVGVIIGAETRNLLHIVLRNKFCSVCDHHNGLPPPHTCYKNWDLSSPSMEPDIILEGFLEAEKIQGVRYMTLIGDGDSK